MEREFYNDMGQKIGWIEKVGDESVFRKKVLESKHLMRNLDAWGIDESVYEQIKMAWCDKLQVLDMEKEILYEIPFNRFEQNMVVRDFGWGRQVFVSRDKWDKKHGR